MSGDQREPTALDHLDNLQLETSTLLALAELLEDLGNAKSMCPESVVQGVAAIGRVMTEKIKLIDQHANAAYQQAR